MAIPPNRELRLRFDAQGNLTNGDPRDFQYVSNQDIVLEVLIQKLDEVSVPPKFNPVDITTWTGQWVAKENIDDADGLEKWDVAGVLVGPGPDGRMSFTVDKASVNFLVQNGYSELIFKAAGADPDIRVSLTFSLSKQVLTI